jgi:tetratricopeptide (TPR) repeat protein
VADGICHSSNCAAVAQGVFAVLLIECAGALCSAPLSAKFAYNDSKPLAVVETALMPLSTFSMSIAKNLGLQHHHQRLEQKTGSKVQHLASAVEKAFASPAIAAWRLSNLAIIYHAQGKTKDAIALLDRALTVTDSADQHRVGAITNRLALYLVEVGRKADAEIQFKRAITAFEKSSHRNNEPVAAVLHNLALLYAGQRRYSEAAETALSSLSLLSAGAEHDQSRVFEVLSTLAGAYYAQGRYGDAEPVIWRAIVIAAAEFKTTDARLSRAAANLAVIYKAQGRAFEAIDMFNRALSAAEIAVGPDDVWVGMIANRLAVTYLEQGVDAESEVLFKRAIGIAEKSPSEENLLSAALFNLSALYARQERYTEAEALLKRSVPGSIHMVLTTRPSKKSKTLYPP